MQEIESESLRDRLDRERRLPVEDAIGITRELASALQQAHGRGVWHHHIAPHTIRLVGGRATLAEAGSQPVNDSAPEAHSDLYALGSVLFEMLAGRRPYLSSTARGLAAERARVPVPQLRTWRETVHPAVDALVTSLLAVSPEDRVASAEALLAALDELELHTAVAPHGQPVVTHVRDVPEVSPQHALRNATIGVALALFALWLGVQLVGSR